ncbi:hypothetical protein SUGI_0286570 [Cryptomeria japonica]|uniref:uncharacterized protein LOC131033042 n=1 Tax=Cryptomeria japonica TaxID=3369 RepID=UPI002408DDE2|nr:uncharacterized protein LOC131033042 [Cryptomeria japonica]GLJ16686.1 hypothetical protein SUGI_0286570 [Cryptomeria japonica]
MASTLMKALLTASLAFSMLFISAESSDDEKSVYEVLESYNFPKGILPTNAQGYVLNPDASFQVYLDKLCSFAIEAGYQLKYQSMISGKISPGYLKNLRGISVKITFFWIDISAVELRDGQLKFYVGFISAAFPLSNFYVCPTCGCGLDCSGRPVLLDSY